MDIVFCDFLQTSSFEKMSHPPPRSEMKAGGKQALGEVTDHSTRETSTASFLSQSREQALTMV